MRTLKFTACAALLASVMIPAGGNAFAASAHQSAQPQQVIVPPGGPNGLCWNGGPVPGQPPGNGHNAAVVAAGVFGSPNTSVAVLPGQGQQGPIPPPVQQQPDPGPWGGMFQRYPAQFRGCLSIWTNQQTYNFGQPVYACYTVPYSAYVDIELHHYTSGAQFPALSGLDDGTGGCDFLGWTGIDSGWRELSIHFYGAYGVTTASTYYWVN
jgi:hypothetical protein